VPEIRKNVYTFLDYIGVNPDMVIDRLCCAL